MNFNDAFKSFSEASNPLRVRIRRAAWPEGRFVRLARPNERLHPVLEGDGSSPAGQPGTVAIPTAQLAQWLEALEPVKGLDADADEVIEQIRIALRGDVSPSVVVA